MSKRQGIRGLLVLIHSRVRAKTEAQESSQAPTDATGGSVTGLWPPQAGGKQMPELHIRAPD